MTRTLVDVAETEDKRSACFLVRKLVFVDEQNVPMELELDHYDEISTHYLLTVDGQPAGTARLIDKDGVAKIGRVAVLKQFRGRGLGLQLMQFVIADAVSQGYHESVLDAQTYAVPFYERLGYTVQGDIFDDAGIPHLHMRRLLGMLDK